MDNHTIPKESIAEKLSVRYNPEAIGEIEKYPPKGEYFVTLYFGNDSFTMANYYNVKIDGKLYDFEISNIAKAIDETNVTVKINVQ
jgi:hypothetical protein